jgi:glycosyltransferase involved in cell wall biosynthesis
VRDLWPKAAQALGELSNPRLYRWAEALEQRLYDRADRITATTRSFCRYIAGRGIPAAKVIHVPNGTLEDVFSPERGDAGLRQRLGLDGKLVVVFAGLHGIAQDLEMVLDTAVRLRDEGEIAFVFLGEGPRKAALMEAARTQGLDQVRFLPQVPLEESAHYLNLADVVLVPLARDRIFDMFVPSKLFDGLACGKPVLLSVDGEAREILEESGGGLFVPPGDAEALAAAIRHLFRHPEIRKEMGERGRLFVTQHYRRRVQAQRFAEVVADVASARAGRR